MQAARLAIASVALVTAMTLSGCTTTIVVLDVPPRLDMGIEADAVGILSSQGVHVTYGTVWVGAWNLELGWRDTEEELRDLAAANVTPLVQFYYWGDELSPQCFQQGCLAGTTPKSQDGWHRFGTAFAEVAKRSIGDRPFVVVIESEFNKNGMHTLDEWDVALANMTSLLRDQLPTARFVLGFGNWGEGGWARFDQAVAAADAVGLQAMRGTTVDDAGAYLTVAERTVQSARILREVFGKPILLHDVALSSYPEPEGLALQETAMRAWIGAEPDLVAAGVEAFVYRAYWDVPHGSGYFREAEHHWGLVRAGDNTSKPALGTWTEWARGSAPEL